MDEEYPDYGIEEPVHYGIYQMTVHHLLFAGIIVIGIYIVTNTLSEDATRPKGILGWIVALLSIGVYSAFSAVLPAKSEDERQAVYYATAITCSFVYIYMALRKK